VSITLLYLKPKTRDSLKQLELTNSNDNPHITYEELLAFSYKKHQIRHDNRIMILQLLYS